MKFLSFFLVIFATIIVNVNSESPTIPPNPPTPDFRQVYAHVDACDQPNELGSKGPESLLRFYYNTEVKECQSFLFGGGPYTENNFLTKEACDERCPNKLLIGVSTTTYSPPRNYDRIITHGEHACSQGLITDSVPPIDAVERFYFNGNECKSFMYGGGVTTENHFLTKNQCLAHCISASNPDYIATPFHSLYTPCSDPIRLVFYVIIPSDAVERFYYNAANNDCVSLWYTNGATIGDIFVTKEDCMAQCGH